MSDGRDIAAPRAAERWRGWEIAFWAFAAGAFFLFPSHLVLASHILIAGLFALSLDLILGYAGIVTLGHAAFFGAGAYVAGLLARAGWGEPVSGLLLAATATGVLGWLTSHLVVRGHDLTRLMVTLGIGLLLYEAANSAAFITGGVDGLQGVEMWPLLGLFRFDLWGRVSFIYTFTVAFALFMLARRLIHSPFGLSLRGIRDNPQRAQAIGIPLRARLVKIYSFAAALAGVAGALLAQTTEFVALEVLSFQRSADVLIMLILGGVGLMYGGFVGAAVYLIAQDKLAGISPTYWLFWLGAILVVIVLFVPGGLLGGLTRLRNWIVYKRGGGA